MDEQRRNRARLQFIGIAALFLAPLAAAVWLYVAVDHGEPTDATANGELVHPARPLGDFELAGAAGHAALDDEALHGKWTLAYVGGATCDERCVETLWESRQVRIRLGRDADRVQRVYLLAGADEPADAGFLAAEHPDLRVARADDGVLATFGAAAAGQLFVIDPLGNVMMRYPADAPPKALLEDLKRLLRVSRIG